MADVIITLKIMPQSPSVNLAEVEKNTKVKIKKFSGETQTRTEIEPIAFGLKALKITFVMDEKIGATDSLEKEIEKIKGVNSVEVVDVRRALG